MVFYLVFPFPLLIARPIHSTIVVVYRVTEAYYHGTGIVIGRLVVGVALGTPPLSWKSAYNGKEVGDRGPA